MHQIKDDKGTWHRLNRAPFFAASSGYAPRWYVAGVMACWTDEEVGRLKEAGYVREIN